MQKMGIIEKVFLRQNRAMAVDDASTDAPRSPPTCPSSQTPGYYR
jgi:hypothetical protein